MKSDARRDKTQGEAGKSLQGHLVDVGRPTTQVGPDCPLSRGNTAGTRRLTGRAFARPAASRKGMERAHWSIKTPRAPFGRSF
jgi:hypothetical protein